MNKEVGRIRKEAVTASSRYYPLIYLEGLKKIKVSELPVFQPSFEPNTSRIGAKSQPSVYYEEENGSVIAQAHPISPHKIRNSSRS
jgi:hypothetical protein